jgi:polyhydroxyalkanoate synthesis regulator phasin
MTEEKTTEEKSTEGTTTDLFQKFLLLGLGAASATKEKLEQVVSDMVGEGKISEGEGRKLLDEVVDRSKEEAESMRKTIKEETTKALAAMGLATKEDLKHVEVEIEKLRDKINDLLE